MSRKQELLKAVQGRLKTLGYYHGIVDGIEGPLTNSAIVQFKTDNGLRSRPFIGGITLQTLFDKNRTTPVRKYNTTERRALQEAYRLLGTKEFAGKADNPIIMDWAEQLDQWYPGDDVPWCGLFIAHCESVGSPDEPQDFNRLGARNWLQYGVPCDPGVGAIGVFWRTHPTKSWNGHVAYIIGEDASTYHILGGNQSDAVTKTRIAKKRLLGCRVPEADRHLVSGKLEAAASGSVSTNEA